jgi:hypothetical protein
MNFLITMYFLITYTPGAGAEPEAVAGAGVGDEQAASFAFGSLGVGLRSGARLATDQWRNGRPTNLITL